MKAYKLFKLKNGELHPLYIYTEDVIPIGEWVDAKLGYMNEDGTVKSKLGKLAFRPGFHSCNVPIADHIGKKQADGTLAQAKDTVWCEVEITDNIDYNPFVKELGINKNGIVIPVRCYMKEIPYDGFYFYKTNPNAKAEWLISGAIKVNKIMTSDEVEKECKNNGFVAQKLEA